MARRSRARVRCTFAIQYAWLLTGTFVWREQPCQKQPSTKIASRARLNPKSGDPANTGCGFHPETPPRWSRAANASSVVAFPLDLMAAIRWLVRE